MNWLRRLINRDELERRLDAELRDHFERQVADHMRSGLSEAEARRQARLDFGGLEQVKEECRDARGTRRIEAIRQDLQYAIRSFARSPRFGLTAILAVAMAVGTATAVFSVVDRSLFRPLPYGHQDRLVSVGIVAPVISTQDWLFAGTYQEWQRSQTAFDAMTAWKGVLDCDRSDGTPEKLGCVQVEASFLPTLGVSPLAGRNFAGDDENAAIITAAYWKSRFGSDLNVLRRSITIDGLSLPIIGVLPADFESPTLAPADVLVPLKLRRDSQRQRLVSVIGRLRPSVSVKSAQQRMAPLFQRFSGGAPADFRKAAAMQLRIATLRDQQIRGYRLALWMLLGAVLSFVLIACANVAHLVMARSATRRPEFAIRASLGASRWRLAAQALIESALLGLGGAGLGWLLANILLRVFQSLAPERTLRVQEAVLDWRVFAFAIALSLISALLFGLAPAIERLQGESLTVARVVGRSRNWLRPALVSLQVTISVVLLTGTGLFLVSLWHLQQTPLGFHPETVVTAAFTLPAQAYPSGEKQIAFFNDLERRLEATPGVVSSAITDSLPPAGEPRSRPFVALVGGGDPVADTGAKGLQGLVKWRYVTRGYFDALGVQILHGRAFSEEDRVAGRQAIIMSESLAKRLFGAQDPVGKQFRLPEAPAEIVGISADVRNGGLQQMPDPEFYVLRSLSPTGIWSNQRPPFGWRQATAIIRSNLPDRDARAALEAAIRQSDPSLLVVTGSFESQVRQYAAAPRFQAALLTTFALLGLVLAAVGLYGLTSYMVAERTREVGVRIALGATSATVVRMMMRQGIQWTLAGVVLGTIASAAVMRSLRSLLFEVEPLDARVFASAILLLVAVALLGTWLPSARAARIDPMEALRQE